MQLSTVAKPAVVTSHPAQGRSSNWLKVSGRIPRSAVFRHTLQASRSRPSISVLASESVAAQGAGVVNDETWEEVVLKSPVPVLVDFWAPWCGPCRMIAPLVDELSVEYGDKLRTLKLNTDESPTVATDYGIRSIPTVMLFKDGTKLDAVIGAVPKATLKQAIDKHLANQGN